MPPYGPACPRRCRQSPKHGCTQPELPPENAYRERWEGCPEVAEARQGRHPWLTHGPSGRPVRRKLGFRSGWRSSNSSNAAVGLSRGSAWGSRTTSLPNNPPSGSGQRLSHGLAIALTACSVNHRRPAGRIELSLISMHIGHPNCSGAFDVTARHRQVFEAMLALHDELQFVKMDSELVTGLCWHQANRLELPCRTTSGTHFCDFCEESRRVFGRLR